jgi:GntR family transcriptional repressor for pyruvate dehydrogenase complex
MFDFSESVSRNTLVSQITRELRQMIADGRIKPGEFFPPQRELAAQFGVGLSTIREALQKLAAIDLVQSHPGKGTWVNEKPLSPIITAAGAKTRLGELGAREVYEARSIIEVALTIFAAQRATPEEIQHIWDTIQAMRAASNTQDFVDADLDFHFAVAAAGHNNLLEQFYHLTRQLLSEIISELVSLPEVKEKSIVLQQAIAQAIETSDVETAQAAALEHMRYIEALLDTYE